jgi:glycogen(starch) synthase
MGVTPVVADYAGPAELVDDRTGIKISFSDKASLVDGLRSAIEGVVKNPQMLDELGLAAREKVLRRFTWEAKATQILQVYKHVLSGTPTFPTINFESARHEYTSMSK